MDDGGVERFLGMMYVFAIADLSERQIIVMLQYFFCGKCHTWIARSEGVSRQVIGAIINRSILKIKNEKNSLRVLTELK